MTSTVKMSVFNIDKNCLIDFSVFVLKFSLFNNFGNLAGNPFFIKCISGFCFKKTKFPNIQVVKGFLKELCFQFYSIFFFNNFNFRK